MGKGRERVRSDRRASKTNAAAKPRKPSPAPFAKSAPVRPTSRAGSPKVASADAGPDLADPSPRHLLKYIGERAADRVELWDEKARRSSLENAPSPVVSTDSLHSRASLMLEIMDSKSSSTPMSSAAKVRASPAPVWRPPRRPALTQNGTPDPYAFARDELIAAPHGLWAHGANEQHNMAVRGVSVSHVEHSELKLLEHFADTAMELDEKQQGRMVTPLNDQPVDPTVPKAKKSLSHNEVGHTSSHASPEGTTGQKRQRSDEPAQFSPELERIGGEGNGQGSDVDGNKAKRVALNKPEGKRDAANSAAGASTKEGQKETETDVKEPAATEPSPASTSAKGPADASSAATSDAKAHSPAVSPVDCAGAMGQPAAQTMGTGVAAQQGKAEDGLQSTRLHSRAKVSVMNGAADATVGMASDDDIQQPSPSAFRRLSSRGALNLG